MKRSKAGTQWFLTYRDLGPPSLRKGRSTEKSTDKEKKRKPRPDWDETIHDLSQYKLTEAELEERKQAVVSKNAVRIPRSEVENWVPQFGYDERGRFHSYIVQPKLVSEDSSLGGSQRHQERPPPWRPGGTPNFLEHLDRSRSPLRQPVRGRHVAEDELEGPPSGERSNVGDKGGGSGRDEQNGASAKAGGGEDRGSVLGVNGVVDFDEEVSRFEAQQRLIQSLSKRKKPGPGQNAQPGQRTELSEGGARREGREARAGRGFDEQRLAGLERDFLDLEARLDSHAAGGWRPGRAVQQEAELREAAGLDHRGKVQGDDKREGTGTEDGVREERAKSSDAAQQGTANNSRNTEASHHRVLEEGKVKTAFAGGGGRREGSPSSEAVSAPSEVDQGSQAPRPGASAEQSGTGIGAQRRPSDASVGAPSDGQARPDSAGPQPPSSFEGNSNTEHEPQGGSRDQVSALGGPATGVKAPPGPDVGDPQRDSSGGAADRSEGANGLVGAASGQPGCVENCTRGSSLPSGPEEDRGHGSGDPSEREQVGSASAKKLGGSVPGRRPAMVERTAPGGGRSEALVNVSPVDTMAHLERLSQGLQTCLAENRSLMSDFAEFRAHASTILTGLQLHVQKLLEVMPPNASHVAAAPPPAGSSFRHESGSAEPGPEPAEPPAGAFKAFEIHLPTFDEDLVDSIPLPSYAELRSLPPKKPPLVERHQRRSEAVRTSTGLAPIPRSLPALLRTSLRSSHASR